MLIKRRSAVMGPNNGRKSHEFESDWFLMQSHDKPDMV